MRPDRKLLDSERLGPLLHSSIHTLYSSSTMKSNPNSSNECCLLKGFRMSLVESKASFIVFLICYMKASVFLPFSFA